MFKLKVRSKPMIAAGALVSIGAPVAAYFILKGMPDKLLELHVGAVVAAIVVLPILVTLVAYQMTSAAQKIKLISLMIAMILFFLAVDNFIFPQMRVLADLALLINYIAFPLDLIGGILAICLFVSASAESAYSDTISTEKEDPKERKRREQEEKEAEKAMAKSGSDAIRSTMARMPAVGADALTLKPKDDEPDATSNFVSTTSAPATVKASAGATTQAKDEERKAGSTSATNLKGILDTFAPDEEPDTGASNSTPKVDTKAPVKSMLKIPQKPDSPTSQLTKPGSTPTPATPVTGEQPAVATDSIAAQTGTTTRLQAQKRKGTSTFTKLQALSASGSGQARTGKQEGDDESGEGLKSILDRLDNPADSNEEAPMDSLFGGGRLVASGTDISPVGDEAPKQTTQPSSLAAATGIGLGNTPGSPPSQLKRPGLGVTLGGNKPKPEVAPPAPAPAPAASSAPVAEPAPAQVELSAVDTSGVHESGASISDMLNSIQTPSVLKDASSGSPRPAASSGLGATSLGKAANTKKIGIGALGSTSSTNLTPVGESAIVQEPEAFVETPQAIEPEATAEVSDDSLSIIAEDLPTIEAISSEPSAEDLAALEEASALEELARLEAEVQTLQATADEDAKLATQETTQDVSSQFTESADEEESSLFAKGLDQEIDDIFSNLVPEEAQKEVKDMQRESAVEVKASAVEPVRKPVAEEPATPVAKVSEPEIVSAKSEPTAEAKESEGGLFVGLDQELDDIFSNLVPAEAQKEVDKPAATITASQPVEDIIEKADETEEEEESSLFGKSLDSELDDIFSNLAPSEAQQKVTSETLAQVRGAAEVGTKDDLSFAPPEDVAASKGGKFVDTLGNLPAIDASKTSVQLSSKQDGAGENEAPKTVSSNPSTETAEHPVAEISADEIESQKATNPPKEVKEFGRLSARVSATAQTSETPGTMKTIGKLLIDVQAVENVIRNGETGQIGKNLASARVLSAARGEGIQLILNKIDAYPGIAGSLIVGHDGLVIASTVGEGMDRDSLGVLSVACLSTSNLGTRKLEIGKLKQMVMITNSTISILTDVDVGILAVFMKAAEIDKIDGLLQTIHTTIHG